MTLSGAVSIQTHTHELTILPHGLLFVHQWTQQNVTRYLHPRLLTWQPLSKVLWYNSRKRVARGDQKITEWRQKLCVTSSVLYSSSRDKISRLFQFKFLPELLLLWWFWCMTPSCQSSCLRGFVWKCSQVACLSQCQVPKMKTTISRFNFLPFDWLREPNATCK